MAIDVRMPKLSDNMEEGVIIRWMKAPGDTVAKGEPLAEVETDKADVELEASDSGVLREIKVQEGESAAVGAVIAVLGGADEAASDGGRAASTPAPAQRESRDARQEDGGGRRAEAPRGTSGNAAASIRRSGSSRSAKPAEAARRTPDDGDEEQAPSRAGAGRTRPAGERAVRASPLAWRLADEAGVNLASVRGSGPGGRILKRDVEASVRGPARTGARDADEAADIETGEAEAPEEREAADGGAAVTDDSRAADAEEAPPAPARARAAGARVTPASRMRLAIAKRMTEAKRDIPHFYVGSEIDMTEAMRLRESIKQRDAMPGLTVTHLILRALAIGLVRHPRLNASWSDGGIELHDDVNIGIAVAVDDGLVVPVLHRAQTLTLGAIAARSAELTEKARSGKFSGAELTGGTFSLSNVGMLDVEELVAVINPPQAAILAVAAVKERPIVRDGQLAVAKTMRATLSCDHRVLNGVEGGRFLEELKGILENPVTLLLDDTRSPRPVAGGAPSPPGQKGGNR